ncbi:MAG: SAM-dependent chlorinase/fluorinase [candidate division KSB1 bacterium]|nr:SAM-dependent chlorinase/fluorinase [candidate division KSB1 bacterium]
MSGFRPVNEPRTVTLLTDFGDQDAYVGILKGVISTINPGVRMIDITHRIQQGDIRSASFVINQAHSFFPEGTVHLMVVDPGVGTDRRPIAVRADSQFWVAPDNGVLAHVYRLYPNAEVIHLDRSEFRLKTVSNTFHGRDIFAPAAAWLSNGVDFLSMGTRVSDFDRGYAPKPQCTDDSIRGEIIYIDHFGNCVSNLPGTWLKDKPLDCVQMQALRWNRLDQTYGHVSSGESLVLIGSHKNLEIAVCNGNAARRLNVHMGDQVNVYFKK